ncbi:PREDICTED: dehydrodolichyl diphosphate synthase complex subunit nus1-like isoform X1 [Lupinus angustifolius]|nr:PREDICTED: dehydrodolichyl diphosphate synthase complex subunit nus1-like isoform X1 [Lupinus angustifolius]
MVSAASLPDYFKLLLCPLPFYHISIYLTFLPDTVVKLHFVLCWIMALRYGARKLSHPILTIVNLGLQLLWYILQTVVSIWYFISAMANLFESYFISYGFLKKYKSLHLENLRYLAIVIESEDAHQTSKVVKLLRWLDSIGVKNVCLYDMNGVLKKSKEAIFQKLKNAKSIEETNEAVTKHVPDHMTLEIVSYVDGKEAVAKAANLIFVDKLKQHNLGGELSETHLNEALQIVGFKGPEPDLLLVYGPVRCHLGFPAWRMRYTEIVHMGSLSSMRYGSLIKAIYIFTKVNQNYGT